MDNGHDDNIIEMKKRGKEFVAGQGRPFLMGALIVLAVILFSKAVTIIPAGHVGVKDFFGNIRQESIPAGFHIINPLLTIHKMDIRTQELSESARAPSSEGMIVDIDVTLLYSLKPDIASNVYKTVGSRYASVLVVPQLRSVVRGVTASYEAKALYTSARETITLNMLEQLKPALSERGIQVEKVLLRSVKLPDILSAAIEEKLKQEQIAAQMIFVLKKEKKEAERKRIEAKGISDFQKIVNLGLTQNYLRWRGIEVTEKLASSQNAKTIVIGSGKDGLPIILGGNN